MANKNTNMILAVAVIAVCAIAIIGVGYAYTATTENTGNDSSVKYITLTQGNDSTAAAAAATYANAFDKEITYDTVTKVDATNPQSPTVKTTYTLTAGQTTEIVSGTNAVELGTVVITASKTNTQDGFIFSVKDDSTTNGPSKMTGAFYIGIKVGTGQGSTEYYRLYEAATENYYITTTDVEHASTTEASASTIGGSSDDDVTITVKMYYKPTDLSATVVGSAGPDIMPLEGVKFTFTAKVPTPTP